MTIKTCFWVRARLPLLAGGDSLGLDRRVVERHLLRCAGCRRRLESLRASQSALAEAADAGPAPPSAPHPPLWPTLARQIRESRRPRSAWAFESGWAWGWPALGLASGLLLALAMLGTAVSPRNVPVVGELTDASLKSVQGLLSRGAPAPPRLQRDEQIEALDRQRQLERRRREAADRQYSRHDAAPFDPQLPMAE